MTMLLRPNPASGVPVYLQLMDQVKDALAIGALRPGEPLPGIRPLARELVINPNTVARAYRGLEQEGVITQRHRDDFPVVAGQSGNQFPATGSRRSHHQLVFENSQLTAQIAAEVADRARRTRDLHSAREVQERLFP